MDSINQEKESKESKAAANQATTEESEGIASMYPPTLKFTSDDDDKNSSSLGERDYAAEYKHLQNDNINHVPKSHCAFHSNFLVQQYHGKYETYNHIVTKEPWFLGERDKGFIEPYKQEYRDVVIPGKRIDQLNYISFDSARVKVSTEDGPIYVDSGGNAGVNTDKVGFEFNMQTGDFAITNDLLPLGEISGNIMKPPTFGIDAKFKPQIGIVMLDPEDWSFEIELSIPGAPMSPAIIICGRINKSLIKKDFDHLIIRDLFPFIGQIVDELPS